MRTSIRSFAFLSIAAVVGGCGVRTALELHGDAGDAGVSRVDATFFDAALMDASWDGGACTGSAQCDDTIFCNGTELCVGGHCQHGPPVNCDDGISCTADQCVEGGGCVSRPNDALCPPGLRCDARAGCVPGMMRCRGDFDCDDHLVCNGAERCDPGTGVCFAGPPMFCGDSVSCTDDSCVEGFGCVHAANSAECPLNQICNAVVGCQAETCTATGSCDDGDPCNGSEFCSADGRCNPGSPLMCNDGNSCTIDFCQTGVGCVSAVQPESCADGIDNDCNGLVDCMDPACTGRPGCPMGCVPSAPFEQFCLDMRDDDCNGLIDCMDPACIGRPECGTMCVPTAPFEQFCNDGRDNDCNGLVDCADFACLTQPGCGPSEGGLCSFPEVCDNGVDDDCNGLTDCFDLYCQMTDPMCGSVCVPTSSFELRCANGLDDDCDGLLDCADPDCFGHAICTDAGAPDSGIVFADSGTVTHELGVAACTNGLDDDMDGRIDCADPDCRPFGAMGECCNGIDDNGDGNVDELTCRCFDQSFCGTVGSLDQVCWTDTFSVCAPRCNFYGGNAFCANFMLTTCDATTGQCH